MGQTAGIGYKKEKNRVICEKTRNGRPIPSTCPHVERNVLGWDNVHVMCHRGAMIHQKNPHYEEIPINWFDSLITIGHCNMVYTLTIKRGVSIQKSTEWQMDFLFLGITVVFFVMCFGVIKYFDSLARNDSQ